MSRSKMIELQKKVIELKGGVFALLPQARVYISPEEWKEIARLEKRIEKLRQNL
tara:strand:- start:938 stop:1099 length:162 start_codon:yes stop_codon:yes gene_type:complete